MVAAYNAVEIQALLDATIQKELEVLQFFLFTGAREQEVRFATWRDLDLDARTFTVRENSNLGFTPKDKEEGAIPIPIPRRVAPRPPSLLPRFEIGFQQHPRESQ